MLHFLLEKIEKNSKFLFFEKCFQMASNDSKWVLKHHPDPKIIFWKPPCTLGIPLKKFWQNRFLGLKRHFSTFKAVRAWKTHFLAKFKEQKFFFSDFVAWLPKSGGASRWTHEKICRLDFWFVSNYFLKKVIFASSWSKN